MSEIPALDVRTWRRGEHVRQYVQNWRELCGSEIEYYTTGNVSRCAVDGVTISNSRATIIKNMRVWLDPDGTVCVTGWHWHLAPTGITVKRIRGAVLASIDAHVVARD